MSSEDGQEAVNPMIGGGQSKPEFTDPGDQGPIKSRGGAGRSRIARRSILPCLLFSYSALMLSNPAGSSASQDTRANIVIVSIDTLRADHLGVYGYSRNTSPNIDRFARRAIVFDNAFTTLPAHVSLMTATYTTTHGIKGNVDGVHLPFRGAGGIQTLAQTLRELGYETAAFVSAVVLRTDTGINIGFDTFDAPQDAARSATATNSAVRAWLDRPRHKPTLLWVHYFDPHWPYDPPKDYQGAFGKGGALPQQQKGLTMNPYMVQLLHDNYDAEILYTDCEVGKLFGDLRARNLWDKTAVVLTADHGEGLWQHNWLDHGRIYNEQLHVPLVMKLPKATDEEPRHSPRLASVVDVIPTLVGALELPVPPAFLQQFDGVNLLKPEESERFVLAERVHRDREWEPGRRYALIDSSWKLLHLTEGQDVLYDMRTDRGELQNAIGAHPQIAEQMRAHIEEILSSEKRALQERRASGDDSYSPPPLSPKTLEALRALGYVDE